VVAPPHSSSLLYSSSSALQAIGGGVTGGEGEGEGTVGLGVVGAVVSQVLTWVLFLQVRVDDDEGCYQSHQLPRSTAKVKVVSRMSQGQGYKKKSGQSKAKAAKMEKSKHF
jgi:hypothetical protein